MAATVPADTKAYWCPYCGRATVTTYRCSNYNCEKDLAGKSLEPVSSS